MFGFLRRILGKPRGEAPMPPPGRLGVAELARRLGMSENQLRNVPIDYRTFQLPKRSGGSRTICAPAAALKAMQRRILHRLLRRLKAHPCATGFERGHSIVTNALPHVGQDIVIKLDLKDFFGSTSARKVEAYFRGIGWDSDAAGLLTRLCTRDGSLPQGAPTSPRLSNVVNWRLDARLFALTQSRSIAYSRYADDLTFSGSAAKRMNDLIATTKQIVSDEGYTLHTDKKLRIARRHDRQLVTGLVVNQKVALPRSTRRWLRAVEHRLRAAGKSSLTPQQLSGWRALRAMVTSQSAPGQ